MIGGGSGTGIGRGMTLLAFTVMVSIAVVAVARIVFMAFVYQGPARRTSPLVRGPVVGPYQR